MTRVNLIHGYKVCTGCRLLRPRSAFSPNARNRSLLQSRCRNCTAAYARRSRAKSTPARIVANTRAWVDERELLGRIGQRRCSTCLQVGLVSAFRATNSHRNECSACQCRKDLLRRYKLPANWVEDTLAAQGGVCACCKLAFLVEGDTLWQPHVDHNHATRKVRGIIHKVCNVLEGWRRKHPIQYDAARGWSLNDGLALSPLQVVRTLG